MVWKAYLLGLALSLIAFDASAQSRPARELISEPVQGYAYYNRPGATLDEHNEAFRDCFMATNVQMNGQPNPLATGLAFRMVWGGVIQAIGASAAENCMIAKGWRVFQLPENQGRAFSDLSPEAFKAAFAPLVGADTPPGNLARQWDNQTARPAEYHTPSRPRAPSPQQLSTRAFEVSGLPFELRTAQEAIGPSLVRLRGIQLAQAGEPKPGMAIIVVRAIGRRAMTFARTQATGGANAFGIEGGRQGNWQAFEVPVGRWRIAQTSWIIHCLGAPAFDLAAGDVIYAGTFDLEGQVMGPTLNVEDVPDQLAASLRARLRAANYENGSTIPCPYGAGIYPLEIPDAPFEPGYSWGSLAFSYRVNK